MCGDHRLKLRTRQAYGKKRKRAWNKGLKVPIDSVPHPSELSGDDPVDTGPEGADLEAMPSTSGFDGNRIDTDPVNTDPEGADLEAMPSTSGFDGNRIDTVYYTAEEQSEALEGAEEKKRHLASQSASQRKFDLLNVNLESTEIESGTEFVIVDMQVLNAFFSRTNCKECGANTVTLEKHGSDYGLAHRLVLVCSTCQVREQRFSSPRVSGASKITPFEINIRAMQAMQGIGKGSAALTDFWASMNVSHRGLHHKTFNGHMEKMLQAAEAAAAASENESAAVIRNLYKDFLNPPGNIDVIFDGTWKTRGHDSHIGVGCIIELYTGLVIDHEVVSNFCLGCTVGPQPDKENFEEWQERHKCQKNSDCKAGRMEVEEALTMFRRSLAKHELRYTTILSDGDSRTFHALTEEEVYGYVTVQKKDCLNHVHKRMGAALRTLVEKKKAQGNPLGGRGRLTQDRMKKIANYYGYALRGHKHDVPGMKRAVQATLSHMTSTDCAPDHSLCPQGAESWCGYNRALSEGKKPPAHRNSLPNDVRVALEPVFARLSDEALLQRCSDGKTQNASESLHSVIWSLSPKTQHASLLSVRRAVAEAVSRYNQGVMKTNKIVTECLGFAPGQCLARRSHERDQHRLHKANKVHSESEKTVRSLAKRHTRGKDQDYSPGLL
ncbi:unnamed protein product [Ixodes hexagonus]